MTWATRNVKGERSDYSKSATTRLLNRIIVYLSEMKSSANITLLKRQIPGDTTQFPDAIKFLVDNKILITGRRNSVKLYLINPEWKEWMIK
jgi:hypothetical protein